MLENTPQKTPVKASRKPAFTQRFTWKNCANNQFVFPLKYFKPETLGELVGIVQLAERDNCTLKAVGSGHSFSEITQTTGYLVNCHGLKNVIETDRTILKPKDILKKFGYDPDLLAHVENGITIKNLNKYLDRKGLALYNMGAYDAQTIMGVISTSTHGSGICLGPIASSVASIIMVAEGGVIYRIEPENGITDPGKYKAKFPDNILMQNNDWFNAVLVSMGAMGIVYSVILNVTHAYYLKEDRIGHMHETYWDDFKKSNLCELLQTNRHLEIWINPYKINGRHRCLITRRNIFTDNVNTLSPGARARHWLVEFFVPHTEFLIRAVFKHFYYKAPEFIDWSMKRVIDYDGYTDKSFNVLHLGNANEVKGFAAEYAISLKDNKFIEAADKILELAESDRKLGKLFHSAPISLRFVKQSDAFLSMMHGEDKCLIEVPILVGTHAGTQILQRIEKEFLRMGNIRPHWGQYHQLNAEAVRQLYPCYSQWKNIFRHLNKKGTFENSFTERCGF